jgi:putative transposase
MSVLHERPNDMPRSRACHGLGLSRTGTYPRQRSRRVSDGTSARQPRELTGEQRTQVLELVAREEYQDASVRVIHARELSTGRVLASVSTIYRILAAEGQSRERRAQRPPQRHAVPRLTARAPNEAWSWDITKLPMHQPRCYLNLYLVLDLFSRFPVAWTISRKENAAVARHLFEHALENHAIDPGQLVVHQDRGAPMIAHGYREFLDAFGVRRSYSRPRVSNDNPFSESCFKTIKYSPGYPGRFADIDEGRAWVTGFLADYTNRPHEGLNFYTPADVFHGRIDAVHAARQAALDAHYAAYPERYTNGPPQAKRPPETVAINPDDGLASATSIVDGTTTVPQMAEPVHIPAAENVM